MLPNKQLHWPPAMIFCSSHSQSDSTHLYRSTDCQQSMSSLTSTLSMQRKWFNRIKAQFQKSDLLSLLKLLSLLSLLPPTLPHVVQTLSLLPADKLEEWLVWFLLGLSYFSRAPTPYPDSTASICTRDNRAASFTPIFNPDNIWDSITPSAFLFVSTFLPPTSREPNYQDSNYWDQPVWNKEYIPFHVRVPTLEPYSQESSLSPEPQTIARPSCPSQ